MSAFYHICPSDNNFQFGECSFLYSLFIIVVLIIEFIIRIFVLSDTAFMFIIGGLMIIKVLQSRHPDVHANAFIAFLCFAVVIFFTLIGIVSVFTVLP